MNWHIFMTEYRDDFNYETEGHNTNLPNLCNKGKNIMGSPVRKLDFFENERDGSTFEFNHDTCKD